MTLKGWYHVIDLFYLFNLLSTFKKAHTDWKETINKFLLSSQYSFLFIISIQSGGAVQRGGGVVLSIRGSDHNTLFPHCGQTDRCKNITLPQTSFADGNTYSFIQFQNVKIKYKHRTVVHPFLPNRVMIERSHFSSLFASGRSSQIFFFKHSLLVSPMWVFPDQIVYNFKFNSSRLIH